MEGCVFLLRNICHTGAWGLLLPVQKDIFVYSLSKRKHLCVFFVCLFVFNIFWSVYFVFFSYFLHLDPTKNEGPSSKTFLSFLSLITGVAVSLTCSPYYFLEFPCASRQSTYRVASGWVHRHICSSWAWAGLKYLSHFSEQSHCYCVAVVMELECL